MEYDKQLIGLVSNEHQWPSLLESQYFQIYCQIVQIAAGLNRTGNNEGKEGGFHLIKKRIIL